MNDGALLLGVDGGTTKTIALVVAGDGRVLGYARGAGSNVYAGVEAESVATIAATATAAALMAGTALGDLDAAALSLAGADCDEDIAFLHEQAGAIGLGTPTRVVNDSVGALYAACPAGPAAVAVCGTGFTASARSRAGDLWYGGHWTDWTSGRGHGDLGGRPMAEAAVRAVVDAYLGLGPATELTSRLLESFGVDTVQELLHAVTARGVHHPWMRADVTGQLLTCANGGDPSSVSIVSQYGAAMGDLVAVAATRTGAADEPFDLALMGSVLRAPCDALRESLLDAVADRVARFDVVSTDLEPAHGAVLVAAELLSGSPDGASAGPSPAFLATLAETSPPPELFHTAAGTPAGVGEMS